MEQKHRHEQEGTRTLHGLKCCFMLAVGQRFAGFAFWNPLLQEVWHHLSFPGKYAAESIAAVEWPPVQVRFFDKPRSEVQKVNVIGKQGGLSGV